MSRWDHQNVLRRNAWDVWFLSGWRCLCPTLLSDPMTCWLCLNRPAPQPEATSDPLSFWTTQWNWSERWCTHTHTPWTNLSSMVHTHTHTHSALMSQFTLTQLCCLCFRAFERRRHRDHPADDWLFFRDNQTRVPIWLSVQTIPDGHRTLQQQVHTHPNSVSVSPSTIRHHLCFVSAERILCGGQQTRRTPAGSRRSTRTLEEPRGAGTPNTPTITSPYRPYDWTTYWLLSSVRQCVL